MSEISPPPPFLDCRFFTSVRAVLHGACHMVAMQISAEPLVRQALRQVFQSRALLSVKPTKKGRKVCVCVCVTLITIDISEIAF